MEMIKTNEATVSVLKKMIEGLDVCILITTSNEGRRHNRPMAAIRIDNEGYCWFFASRSSGKLKDIAANNKLQVVFADASGNNYVEIHGIGTVVCDENELKDKWSPLVNEWFPGGIKDPEVCLVKADITNIFFWDEITGGIQRLSIKTTTVVEAPGLAA